MPTERPRWHLGADHAGLPLKAHLRQLLEASGLEVVDHGPERPDPVDYPDYAGRVARAVRDEPGSRGLLVCGSGVGMSMAANRFSGVRAVLAGCEAQAALSRRHNDANVLCLGARLTTPQVAERILEAFVTADFEAGRHVARVEAMDQFSDLARTR